MAGGNMSDDPKRPELPSVVWLSEDPEYGRDWESDGPNPKHCLGPYVPLATAERLAEALRRTLSYLDCNSVIAILAAEALQEFRRATQQKGES